ncbi:MAG: hypothetical protein AVDCRST_MAG01-01-5 [uncultured Rubrobacteraceae bacterium]|uniref:Uncharacterized protein n=1 Tax=uncultured Rubrobacteraceae bacterium TaxID=349277 RepID=A0A6J4NC21_9ACTN|nr:MAG: hypothetical protein AVDCRST_MAG01-01-5 [uncultured Rubrobacteraceae bacterium]
MRILGPLRDPSKKVRGRLLATLYLVWGRVVADIPDLNRELVAVLAGQRLLTLHYLQQRDQASARGTVV